MDVWSTRENELFIKYPKPKIYIHDVDGIFILTNNNDESKSNDNIRISPPLISHIIG